MLAPISANALPLPPTVAARLRPRAEADDRDLLTGVIGAAPGRIVAVIRSKDAQIARRERRLRFSGTRRVEGLERAA